MLVVETVSDMQSICADLRWSGRSISFVPTMGALHDGHGSLIKRAFEDNASHSDASAADIGDTCDRHQTNRLVAAANRLNHSTTAVIVVSIFTNPAQFNDRNDFVNYPKTTDADLERCRILGVDYVFVPSCEEIYPASQSLCDKNQPLTSGRCIVRPPLKAAHILEGKSRKDHFEGVLTVITKMFNIIQPSRAYFGEKDFQQLVLVTRMIQDLNMPIRICAVETVREAETNLPLSSRNIRLDFEQRRLAAIMMYQTLASTKKCLEDKCRRGNQLGSDFASGEELNVILLASMMTTQLCLDLEGDHHKHNHLQHCDNNSSTDSAQITVDYFELRCAKDLSPIDYDQHLALYDCQRGCVRSRSPTIPDADNTDNNATLPNTRVILEARLLISIVASKVRLLDNIGVLMNL